MLFAWAIDDSPVSLHDFIEGDDLLVKLFIVLHDKKSLIYGHNSHFDQTMFRHKLLQCQWPKLFGVVNVERPTRHNPHWALDLPLRQRSTLAKLTICAYLKYAHTIRV